MNAKAIFLPFLVTLISAGCALSTVFVDSDDQEPVTDSNGHGSENAYRKLTDTERFSYSNIPTDGIITEAQADAILKSVTLPNRRVPEVVNAIVNVKLIFGLQFSALTSFYNDCRSVGDSKDGNCQNYLTDDVDVTNSHLDDAKCSSTVCIFYLCCVERRADCIETIQFAMVKWLIDNSKKFSWIFSSKDNLSESFGKAIVLAQYGIPSEAVQFISSLIKSYPEHVGLYYARALACARVGLSDKSIDCLLKDTSTALTLNSKNLDSIYRRAFVLLSLSEYDSAIEVLEAGLPLFPSNADLHEIKASCHYHKQEFTLAELHYRNALRLQSVNSANVMQKLALVMYRQGKLANAVSVYKDLLSISPNDSNTMISLSHVYRLMGDSKKSMTFANKVVAFHEQGKIQLVTRGQLYHSMGLDLRALDDLTTCLSYHPTHELCTYNLAIVCASLGQFYSAIKHFIRLVSDVGSSTNRSPYHIKSFHLINYFRYIHNKLDYPLSALDLDKDLLPLCKDIWANSTLEVDQILVCELPALSPFIPPVAVNPINQYDRPIRTLLCQASTYGRLMQVTVDSFLTNQRFNLAMGLAAVDVGQQLRYLWKFRNQSDLKKLSWRKIIQLILPYRRMANIETDVLLLSSIFKDDAIMHHNERFLYRSGIRNLRLKNYYERFFERAKHQIKTSITDVFPVLVDRVKEIGLADTPELLVSAARPLIVLPAYISSIVASYTRPAKMLDGTVVVVGETYNGGSYLYIDNPTSYNKTQAYIQELNALLSKIIEMSVTFSDKDVDKVTAMVLRFTYYFYNFCPLTHGSSSVGFAAFSGMLLSFGLELTAPLPPGKLFDMEALAAESSEEFIATAKEYMKIGRLETPITDLPLVSEALPTIRSLLETLAIEDLQC